MNILAIDTTTKTASVAIQKNNEITTDCITNEITHSEKLLPLIDSTLKKVDLTLNDIDLLGCINGPGSFTGIRIGLSSLKAFAQVKDINIFSMNSLEATAYSVASKRTTNNSSSVFVSLIDSRNNRVYYAIHTIKNECEKAHINTILDISNDDISIALDNILLNLKENNLLDDIYVCGDCINKYTEIIIEKIPTNEDNLIETYPIPTDIIHAINNIADISNYMYNSYTLDAIYARPSQAERVKHGEN